MSTKTTLCNAFIQEYGQIGYSRSLQHIRPCNLLDIATHIDYMSNIVGVL
jgi:hypothetical protein